MKIRLKPFAGLATVWSRLNDFQKARWKLTFLYTFILFLLLNLFSVSLFWVIAEEEKNHITEIEKAWQTKQLSFSGNTNVTIIQWQESQNIQNFSREELLDFQSLLLDVIREKILLIELCILLLGAMGSYFLAKRTLAPIQEKSRQQKQFFQDVNHELKNPLAALQTTLEVSSQQMHWTSGEIKSLFSDLKGEIERLSKTTQDILFLETKEEKQKNTENVLLHEVLENTLRILTLLAKEKNISFQIEISPREIQGKREDVEKVFFNLLHNAIKFSHPNGKIFLSCPEKGAIVVQDFGIGISSKDLPHIFDRFWKVDSSRTFSNENGSGLGLSIVKKICDENEWNLEVKSEEGKGSLFRVFS